MQETYLNISKEAEPNEIDAPLCWFCLGSFFLGKENTRGFVAIKRRRRISKRQTDQFVVKCRNRGMSYPPQNRLPPKVATTFYYFCDCQKTVGRLSQKKCRRTSKPYGKS